MESPEEYRQPTYAGFDSDKSIEDSDKQIENEELAIYAFTNSQSTSEIQIIKHHEVFGN